MMKTRLWKTIRFPKGHPKNRLAHAEHKERFRRAASFALKPDRVQKVEERILELESMDDMTEITRYLHN